MKENQHHVRKMFLQIFTLLVLMFVTYYLIMHGKDIGQIWRVVLDAKFGWLVVAAIAMTIYIFCAGWGVGILMKGRGQKVGIGRFFKYALIEFYFSAITPSNTGGQPIELVYMTKDGYSIADSSVVLLATTVLYKAAVLIIAALLFILTLGYISGPISSVWPLALLGLVCHLLLIFVLCLMLFSKKLINILIAWVFKVAGKLHLLKNADQKLAELNEKLDGYHECAKFFVEHKGVVLKCFGAMCLQRLMLLMVPVFVFLSFGLTGYSVLEILATQSLLNLCVDMMPLPGAVGISETVFLMLFEPIFRPENVTSAVLLSRGISFYLLVVASGIVVLGCQIASIARDSKKISEGEGK